MKNKIFILFILLLFISLSACAENFELYRSVLNGSVRISKNKIIFNVSHYNYNADGEPLDYPYNGEYKCETINKNGLTFIKYANQENLILKSDDLIFLRNEKRLVFEGIGKVNGRLLEAIRPGEIYKASSALKEKDKIYEAKNLSHVRLDNPWVEGVSGPGIGEHIKVEWDVEIGGLFIVNGFISFNKPELYENNNRVKKIRIYPDDSKEGVEFILEDTPNPQTIKLGFNAKKIKLEILDVYKGNKWDDTCMSMILGVEAEIGDYIFDN